jgi:hypothetical protein
MIDFKELIGIIATLIILVAFTMKGELKIRIIDLFGAIVFVVYGALIQSFSVILLNAALILLQLYHISKLYKEFRRDNLTKMQRADLKKFKVYLLKLARKIRESKEKYVLVNGHTVELGVSKKGEPLFIVYDNKLITTNYKEQRILSKKETMNFLLKGAEIDFKY